MASYCKVTIIGNVGKDPETRYSRNGDIYVSFSVATTKRWYDENRRQQEKTIWFRCTAWGKLAETMDGMVQNKSFIKGRQVFVSGGLDPREYIDPRSGQKATSLDIRVDDWQLLGSKPTEAGQFMPGGLPEYQQPQSNAPFPEDPEDNISVDLSALANSPFNRM